MKKIYFPILLVLLSLFSLSLPGFSADEDLDEQSGWQVHVDNYWSGVSNKFGFGAINFLLGWTELITEPVDHYEDHKGEKGAWGHAFIGIGHGLVNFPLDIIGGALNLVTSPIPQFRIPLPQGGVNLEDVSN